MTLVTALSEEVSAYEEGNDKSVFTRHLYVGLWGRPDTRCTLDWFNDIVLLASLQYHAEKQEQVRQLLERLTFPIQTLQSLQRLRRNTRTS